MKTSSFVALVAVVAGLALLPPPRAVGARAYRFELPPGFPEPRVPADNPMSELKVELGRRLFYDRRLSANQRQACASCHRQELAFTDGRAHAIGSTGDVVARSSMSLANAAYRSRLTWANPMVRRLEDQALVPMFGDHLVELGLPDAETLLARLRRDPDYVERFAASFPGESAPITLANVTRAIAAFERTLVSGGSPYDRFVAGDASALSASAQRGMELFFSERLECFHCHGGFDFSDSFDHAGMPDAERPFHNTGLYDVDGKGAYPASDRGVYEVTGRPSDMGRFRAPSLRNVGVTAPYMHDGSIATLEGVLAHYEAGGRTVASGPDAGDGSQSPLKDPFVLGFVLTDAERADVIAFLESLTDEAFLHDPRFSDPFVSDPPFAPPR
ncbi:MAG: di-heme enzyme [Polyangiales bacterium]